MKFSLSNVAQFASATCSVTNSAPAAVVLDPDFSSSFRFSNTGQIKFTISFSAAQSLEYVAIGGSNFAKKDRILIDIYNGSSKARTIDKTMKKADSYTLVFDFPKTTATKVEISVFNSGGACLVANISAGELYNFSYGMPAGHSRPWTISNTATRSPTTMANTPLAALYESKKIKCALSFPCIMMNDFERLDRFIRFAASNTFYMLEDSDPVHSCACFGADFSPIKTHAQTPLLGALSFSFSAFARLSEGV